MNKKDFEAKLYYRHKNIQEIQMNKFQNEKKTSNEIKKFVLNTSKKS